MTTTTPEQTVQEFLLLNALGLTTNPEPTRNWLPVGSADRYPEDVAQLIADGLLERKLIPGEGGSSEAILITEAGRLLAEEAHQRAKLAKIETAAQAVDTPAADAAPAKTPRTRTRKVKDPAPAAAGAAGGPAADGHTGDLLGDAAAPAAGNELATVLGADLAAMAMPTIKLEKYVATLFEPMRAKFDATRAEADLIAFTEEGKLHAEALQAEQPEEQRRPVQLVDISTKDGYALAIRMRATFRDDVRLAAEKRHKEKKAPILQIGRLLDSTFAEIRDESKPYEERFDKVIKTEDQRKETEKREAEERERVRVAAIRAKIDAITILPGQLAGAAPEDLEAKLQELATMEPTEEEFGDKLGEMMVALDTVGSALSSLLDNAQKRAADDAQRIREQQAREAQLAQQAEENERAAAQLATQRAEIEAQARVATEAAEALQRQQQLQLDAMGEIQALQMVGATAGGTAIELQRILANVLAKKSTAELYGMAAPMVTYARDMAATQLQAKVDAAVAIELPDLQAEALEEHAAWIEANPPVVRGGGGSGFIQRQQRIIEDIEVEEPAADPDPAPALQPELPPAAPITGRPADGPAVAAFRAAVRELSRTRSMDEIADLLVEEMNSIESEAGHDVG